MSVGKQVGRESPSRHDARRHSTAGNPDHADPDPAIRGRQPDRRPDGVVAARAPAEQQGHRAPTPPPTPPLRPSVAAAGMPPAVRSPARVAGSPEPGPGFGVVADPMARRQRAAPELRSVVPGPCEFALLIVVRVVVRRHQRSRSTRRPSLGDLYPFGTKRPVAPARLVQFSFPGSQCFRVHSVSGFTVSTVSSRSSMSSASSAPMPIRLESRKAFSSGR